MVLMTSPKRRASVDKYQEAHPNRLAATKAQNTARAKLKALQIIQAGGLDRWTGREVPLCARCGCDDLRLLEANHRDGGGSRELEEPRRPRDLPRRD